MIHRSLHGFLIRIVVGFGLDTFFHLKTVSIWYFNCSCQKCELRSCNTLQRAVDVVNAQCPDKLKAAKFQTLSQASTMEHLGSQYDFHICSLLQTSHVNQGWNAGHLCMYNPKIS